MVLFFAIGTTIKYVRRKEKMEEEGGRGGGEGKEKQEGEAQRKTEQTSLGRKLVSKVAKPPRYWGWTGNSNAG